MKPIRIYNDCHSTALAHMEIALLGNVQLLVAIQLVHVVVKT